MSKLHTNSICCFSGLKLYLPSVMLLLFIFLQIAEASDAKWITAINSENKPGTWIVFRKSFSINNLSDSVNTRIAAESKYWLYINNKLVVFEGGLKRGPNPNDTYADNINIRPYLKKGKNVIAVLLCYFGKDGFSHKSSGQAGLFWESKGDSVIIKSDSNWKAQVYEAYSADLDIPNFRLSESNIVFDARKEISNWQSDIFLEENMPQAIEIGTEGDAPWNKLVNRPIPHFYFSEFKNYKRVTVKNDTVICELPYNAQITPYLKVQSISGQKIEIKTDNYIYYNAGGQNIKATYITKNGIQEYESLGWINGHKVYYILPTGVKLIDVKYRESGFNTPLYGKFKCSDLFFNQLWNKAQRTLYLCMRDSYMDCPDRERAQWSGDAVIQSGEISYAFSPTALQMSRKWLSEIIDWQKPDGKLFSPVPSGNWDKELPEQMLATIGYYGLWNYYMQTGDIEMLKKAYPKAKQYLKLWSLEESGILKIRETEWMWGDWGFNIDKTLLYNTWYYLALNGMSLIANEVGFTNDKIDFDLQMKKFYHSFNETFWNGSFYKSPSFMENADDRGQALAVLSGLADITKYSKLIQIFKNQQNASPYMEKYVFEAMIKMGYTEDALKRHKERFSSMVSDNRFSTLFEGWEIGSEIYGGGTVNHAWSGGGLTILSQYLCGITPYVPGYKVVSIAPQLGYLNYVKTKMHTLNGYINVECKKSKNATFLDVEIPQKTSAIVSLPCKNSRLIKFNGKVVWEDGNEKTCSNLNIEFEKDSIFKLKVFDNKFSIKAVCK